MRRLLRWLVATPVNFACHAFRSSDAKALAQRLDLEAVLRSQYYPAPAGFIPNYLFGWYLRFHPELSSPSSKCYYYARTRHFHCSPASTNQRINNSEFFNVNFLLLCICYSRIVNFILTIHFVGIKIIRFFEKMKK